MQRWPGRWSARNTLLSFACLAFVTPLLADAAHGEESSPHPDSPPLILAHYMPWHESLPHSGHWGWHWTMDHFDPNQIVDGRRQLASHFYPLAGCYDSGDPDLLEYHLQLMKLAGIDGVIVDWYGLTNLHDYAILHRNTKRLVQIANRLGMKFAICYEDQTVPALIKAKRSPCRESSHSCRRRIELVAKELVDTRRLCPSR